ncbi:MAG: serine/threonine-protein kinase, partial [Polyangiales bacterium]
MREHAAAAPGTALDAEGRYTVRAVLGEGAFGVVYRVTDERWGLEVALKTMHGTSPEQRQWLKAEYRSLRDIVHPNLVRLHELHADEARCFFTMDVITDGTPFTRRFEVARDASTALRRDTIRRVCRAGAQLADGLRTVHAWGKCHRDIKPSNVLVTPGDQAVLLDFGLSSPVDRLRAFDTARGAVLGSLPYLAPEQYDAPRPLPASDWFS